jgi:uncharacterized membrane protein YfcA
LILKKDKLEKIYKKEGNELNMGKRLWKVFFFALIFLTLIVVAGTVLASTETSTVSEAATSGSHTPWWVWPLGLFVFTFVLGIVAVLGGVGGGVLYVPIVSGFFPFNLDFVRATGLLVALSTALSAGPGLLKRNLASLRLSMPFALIASTASIFGALIGLALPTNVVQTLLGATIIGIVFILLSARKSDFPDVPKSDKLSTALGIMGVYHEQSLGKDIEWRIHRTPAALFLFIIIGVMAGMFGLGAGWANVPVLNLLLGVPLKVSVASSVFLLSITDTAAAWVFINKGAVIPLIVVPSMVGVMLGSQVGVRILARVRPKAVKWFVIGLLFLSGIRALLKGLGIWT